MHYKELTLLEILLGLLIFAMLDGSPEGQDLFVRQFFSLSYPEPMLFLVISSNASIGDN